MSHRKSMWEFSPIVLWKGPAVNHSLMNPRSIRDLMLDGGLLYKPFPPHIPDSSQTLYSSWVAEASITSHSPRPQKTFQNATNTDKTFPQLPILWIGCDVPYWGNESIPFLAVSCIDSFSESRTSVSVFCLNLKHNSFSLPEKSNQTKAVLNIYQISCLNPQHAAAP